MQNGRKAVGSISYVSVAFFPSLKQIFIAYLSSKLWYFIFEIHQLWQSGFSRVYSNCCLRCLFESEIIKIGQSCHKTYSNNIVNFQESTRILNACTKKFWKIIEGTTYVFFFFDGLFILNVRELTLNLEFSEMYETPSFPVAMFWITQLFFYKDAVGIE